MHIQHLSCTDALISNQKLIISFSDIGIEKGITEGKEEKEKDFQISRHKFLHQPCFLDGKFDSLT